jgi:hypothetical protein
MSNHQERIGIERRVPRVPLWVRIVVAVLILGVAVWFFLTSQFGDAKSSFAALENLSPWLVFAALALQILSLMSFSALTGTTLGWGRLPYGNPVADRSRRPGREPHAARRWSDVGSGAVSTVRGRANPCFPSDQRGDN